MSFHRFGGRSGQRFNADAVGADGGAFCDLSTHARLRDRFRFMVSTAQRVQRLTERLDESATATLASLAEVAPPRHPAPPWNSWWSVRFSNLTAPTRRHGNAAKTWCSSYSPATCSKPPPPRCSRSQRHCSKGSRQTPSLRRHHRLGRPPGPAVTAGPGCRNAPRTGPPTVGARPHPRYAAHDFGAARYGD
jgi:hypothetical protein